jgi:hypothetical protein
MATYFAIVNPSLFQSGNEDTNGRKPIILDPIFGVVPNRRIINGTIAHNTGLEVGKTYMVKIEMVDNVNPKTGLVSLQPQVTRLGDGAITAIELAVNGKAFQNAYGNGKVEAAADATEAKPVVAETQEELVDTDGKPVPKDGDEPF